MNFQPPKRTLMGPGPSDVHPRVLEAMSLPTIGVLNEAESLSRLAKTFDCITIADTVTSLGCVPVKVDEWRIDAGYSCSQKGLSCPPGLSPVSFSALAMDKINNRKTKVQNWF